MTKDFTVCSPKGMHMNSFARRIRHAAAVRWHAPMLRRLKPRDYKETYINLVLSQRSSPTTYVEIGVFDGVSFRIARATRKLGVDPRRLPALRRLRSGEEFYQKTSDSFFTDDAPKQLARRSVDCALIDGLHLFEQALLDVLNLEPYMKPDGVIFLDDCNPLTPARGGRVHVAGGWNGDVWKVAKFITDQRPDLRFVTLDADQGLGMVTGFGPEDPVAQPDTLIAQYRELTYEILDDNRSAVLNLIPSAHFGKLYPSPRADSSTAANSESRA
jgi:hypothetical protein